MSNNKKVKAFIQKLDASNIYIDTFLQVFKDEEENVEKSVNDKFWKVIGLGNNDSGLYRMRL